jgi:hypothetical protein
VRCERVAVSAVAVAIVAVALPLLAAAGSSRSWSGPIAVDRTDANQLLGVSCPMAKQCTTADLVGQEVTFDPGKPGRTWRHMIDARGIAVACPSTSLCVSVASQGQHQRGRAFRPKSGRILRSWRTAHTGTRAVTCVSTRQCTAVGGSGREVTFDPETAKIVSNARVVPSSETLTAVACPSARQCSATIYTGGQFGQEVTFDPVSGTAGKQLGAGYTMHGVSCPSTSQCTTVDDIGDEVTFDPVTAQENAAGLAAIAPGRTLTGVSCPSLTQCTAVDFRGNELTFDPATGTANGAGLQPLHVGDQPDYATALDCLSVSQCIAVGGAGKEATFTPASGAGKATLIDRGGSLVAISCPSSSRCTALDRAHEFALRLGGKRARVGRPRELATDFGLARVSCPSATQCTVVDFKDHEELTFNPASGTVNRAGARTIDPAGNLTDVSCPTVTKCVAVDGPGFELTFNPRTGKVLGAPRKLRRMFNVFRVSCPSAHQCTAVDSQEEVTFDPRPSGLKFLGRASFWERYGVSGMNGLSCPSRTECVAIAEVDELAFHPTSGRAIAGGKTRIDAPSIALSDVACSSVHRCVAVEFGGGAVSFNPVSPSHRARTTISQAATFNAVSCAPGGRCVAVDVAGTAFVASR